MNIETLSSLAAVAGVCIAGINIIVEVLKVFWVKEQRLYPALVLGVSLFMSFFVLWIYCNCAAKHFTPLLGTGAFVGGFFLAYGAMFGYDHLYGDFVKKIESIFTEEDK